MLINYLKIAIRNLGRNVIFTSIACPIAWFGLENFLENYSYRISIHWWILPLAGAAALFITLLIVATQAMRAASTSPSESLKCE